jgi:hypothetical protein
MQLALRYSVFVYAVKRQRTDPMPALVLQPSYDDKTRAEIEAHLDAVRARRMVAAIEYQQGVNLKLEHESEVSQRRVASKYAQLGRTLDTLDKSLERIEKLLVELETLHQELGLTEAMLTLSLVDTPEDE